MFGGMIEKRTTYSLEGIDTVWVQGCAQDIVFLYGNNAELEIREVMASGASGVQAERKGSALCLYGDRDDVKPFLHRGHLTITESEKIELKLPESFRGQVYVENFSGDIRLPGMWDMQNFQVKTKSGDIALGCVRAEHLLLESVSGDIDIKQAIGDTQIYSTSGDIYLEKGNGRLHASTVSGDINAGGMSAKTILESKSGDIEAEFLKITETVKIDSISGDVDIKITAGSCYTLMATAVSGDVDVHINSANIVSDNGHTCQARVGTDVSENSPLVQISTISGDIDIHD